MTTGYYDLPVIKAPPWKWYIAGYFYAGGVAGASAVLHGAAKLVGERPLATKLKYTAFAGEVIGAGLLIADLGKPSRFHHMMRVVRPTSPMNVGTWILSAAGGTSALDLVVDHPALTIANSLAGAALATYTGVLVGNTAVPVWKATRNVLPVMFAASAGASAASIMEILGASTPREARIVRTFSVVTKAAAIVTRELVTRAAGPSIVGEPLRKSRLWAAARALDVASLVATVIPRASRFAGILGTAAGIATRFAILEAGRASAAEPRATLTPNALP